MLYRINQAVLALASSLLLAGAAAAVGAAVGDVATIARVGPLAREWLLLVASLCALPVLSWPALGACRLLRRRRLLSGGLAASAWLIVAVNLLFWGLVFARVAPVEQLFEKGRIVWIGERAFLFGHGYWRASGGYWQHQTVIRLRDGTVYRGPTLDLLELLRERGAASVWGSWCYSGNYPYIRKDLITGREVPWPAYASYNRAPGVTIPVWLGTTFVRLGWSEGRYAAEPATLGPVTPDTLFLLSPSRSRIEQSFTLMQQRIRGLPRPDSVSWHPIVPDTVYSMPRREYAALSAAERRAVRARENAERAARARTGLALYWIRGRAFPIYIRVPARLVRPADPPRSAARSAGPAGGGRS